MIAEREHLRGGGLEGGYNHHGIIFSHFGIAVFRPPIRNDGFHPTSTSARDLER